ncbi:hypothetical protein Hanom_Chr07g00623171 [Helianthus anomalus]
MVEAEDVQEQDVENVQEQENAQEQDDQNFMIVGESSKRFDADNVLRKVAIIHRKKKAIEVLLLEWKTNQFTNDNKRKEKKARGEIVDDDSDVDLFRDEEEEEDEDNIDDKMDDKPDDNDDKDDKGDNDNDQELMN